MTLQKEKIYNYYLSLGSNLGDKEGNIENALVYLNGVGKVEKVASFYKNKPWGFSSENEFINTCIQFATQKEPLQLLKLLKEFERNSGRLPSETYADRIIDIDILLCNEMIFTDVNLVIPHVHMHEREFVLKPLSEIAENVNHPVLNKSIKELYQQL